MSRVFPLKGNQCGAVDPRETVWLSASAGTGKTQVLSARVLRLLLQPGVTPSQILCLTFTKAGAAEMAVRVNQAGHQHSAAAILAEIGTVRAAVTGTEQLRDAAIIVDQDGVEAADIAIGVEGQPVDVVDQSVSQRWRGK